MKVELEQLKKEAHQAVGTLTSIGALEDVRLRFLGRKGALAALRERLKDMPEEERKEMGVLFNSVKEEIEGALTYKESLFHSAAMDAIKDTERIDATEPHLPPRERGYLHPNTIVQEELEAVAERMGFLVIDGPELETDYYNFEALNIPKTHPAREHQDTFYIEGHPDWVMRSQVSNMQVRLIEKYGAPLRVAYPGKVFRNEATDASHEHTFFQYEALIVDRNISIGNMVAIIKELLRGVFKRDDVEVRLRPGYFPFTEPSIELDMACLICMGRGCAVCKHTGWVEMLGSGLIHPNVLRAAGLNPREWNGIAYAFGLTRMVMMRYGIEDIRHLMSGDVRFLRQF